MQYYAAIILLHRPSAGFGVSSKSSSSSTSRAMCIQSAAQIACLLSEYERSHGHASHLSGVALHTISTAATILLAELADREGTASSKIDSCQVRQQFAYLKQFIKSLSELEQTYFVARRVRKIIQLIMKLCNLTESQFAQPRTFPKKKDILSPDKQQAPALREPDHGTESVAVDEALAFHDPLLTNHSPGQAGFGDHTEHSASLFPEFCTALLEQDLFNFNDPFPTTSQMDILCSFESFLGCG